MTRSGLAAGIALMLTTTSAMALGLDRSGQDIGAIFEPGGFVELGFGSTQPDLTGTDTIGNPIGNVGNPFTTTALSFKMDINDQLSLGLILDQPYGADVTYAGNPAATMLGGTEAVLNSSAVTALARYRINPNFSVHGGLRMQRIDGHVTLQGQAYGPLSGYDLEMRNGQGNGYVIGAAYERPEIALRVALTYNSRIENTFDTSETLGIFALDSTTTVDSPESWNLDFQSGIAADTLLFGQIRYAMYSQTILAPDVFSLAVPGGSITDLEDATAYTIGVGHRFTDMFSGSVAIGFEPKLSDDLVSPLAPTDGLTSITLGGQYTVDNIVFSGGIRYTMVGDARAQTSEVPRAIFADNDAMSYGFSLAYRF